MQKKIKPGGRNVTSCHPFLFRFRFPNDQFKPIMTLHILIFLIIMLYFVKGGQYELADYMKKHEIVNKIKYGITRAVITV